VNFWKFCDENSFGLFWLAVITLGFAFGTCGDGKGCRFRCEPGTTVIIHSSDGGAP
jgi:hypothetical protein